MSNKQSSKLSTTVIKGTPPAWDDAEFNKRLRVRLHAYDNTSVCTELVSHALEHEWLSLVSEKVASGYTLDRRWPINHAQLSHSVQMVKPLAMQASEKEELKDVVKAEYVQHLQSQLETYRTALTNQLIEAAEEKERRKAEDAAIKRRALAEKESAECFGELVVPDGFPEHPAQPLCQPAVFSLEQQA
ncbi:MULTISPECIES: BREX-1 system adenine-specific DNA-methyltransferase PglX [unclassified Pseudomonas]|uniref:BREX-1 system adenine-specific DNA-methyltransferase PglX n=1 Tax=unclassified Pseudomonas TaxID=196821 RepID=UPI00209838E4|nr:MULTISPECIES: BREX-1 system adenine-specific DNA-methyltransferase PglX [unclassified Pseudomonas]MCO7506775.1 BREX-1 system adenine-specific DNA-methyltransferase PglX [Pseudomonas sp. VE 267-6A]MCO7531481.1 BREX-1 system adenine-specific DNA-methyltransferase PglX [Pseudomonas sp. 2]